jgi:hypothetical protein
VTAQPANQMFRSHQLTELTGGAVEVEVKTAVVVEKPIIHGPEPDMRKDLTLSVQSVLILLKQTFLDERKLTSLVKPVFTANLRESRSLPIPGQHILDFLENL